MRFIITKCTVTITECTTYYYKMYNQLLQNVHANVTKCTTTITKCTNAPL